MQSHQLEISINDFFSMIWHGRLTILIFVLCSVFFSLFFIKNSERIYTAEAIIQAASVKPQSQSLEKLRASALKGVLAETNAFAGSDGKEIVPIIKGREFIGSLIGKIDKEKIDTHCPSNYTAPGILSVAGLLNFTGVSPYVPMSDLQIEEARKQCIADMIDVKKYVYKKKDTSAHSISVKSTDPFFAAALANKIVDNFFLYEKTNRKNSFDEIMTYLSTSMGKAQVKAEQAKQKLDLFLLKNRMNTGSISQSLNNISFETDRNLAEIARLENDSQLLMTSISNLKNKLNLENPSFLEDRVSDYYKVSPGFFQFLKQLENKDIKNKDVRFGLDNEIRREILRLEEILSVAEESIAEREKKSQEFLALNESFQILRIELAAHRSYLSNLEASLNGVALEKGLNLMAYEAIYSKAIPPQIPTSPKIKLIGLLSALVAFVLGVLFLMIRNANKIFSINQISDLYEFPHTVVLSHNDLKSKKISDGKAIEVKGVSLSFISEIANKGKIGCLVEIGRKNNSRSTTTDPVNVFCASICMAQGKKVLSVNSSKIFNNLLYPYRKSSKIVDLTQWRGETSLSLGNVVVENTIPADPKELSQMLAKEEKFFDHIFVSLGLGIDQNVKNSMILSADFFILVGSAGNFALEDINKYVENTGLKKSTCAGFFLIK